MGHLTASIAMVLLQSGTDLCGGGRRSLLLLFMRGFAQRVEGLYNKEHKKRKQYKVEHHGNEFAVVEGGCAAS